MLLLLLCGLLLPDQPMPLKPGTYVLVKEDGHAQVRDETLYIYPDGKLLLDGPLLQRGTYSLKGDTITTTFHLAGEAQVHTRAYRVTETGLELAVEGGFGSYERRDTPLPDWETDTRKLKLDYFTLDVPASWQIRKAPAEGGAQQMTLMDDAGNNALTLQRIPGRGQEVNLPNALKGVIGSMFENLGIQRTVIHQDEGVYFGRLGVMLEATKKFDDEKIVQVRTFGQKLENDSFLVAMFSSQPGGEKALDAIMASLKTPDDPGPEAAAAHLAAEKAAKEAKAAEHDHHDHKGHQH